MQNFTSFEIQNGKDELLIYEVGIAFQRTIHSNENGIHSFRLNKSLSVILRHWDWLRNNSPEHKDIHEWGISHFPYRFGQRIFRSLPNNELIARFPQGVMYLEDIIRTDGILRKLGVKIIEEENKDIENSYFFFAGSSSTEKSELFTSVRLDPRDLFLIKQLSDIYAPHTTEDINSLATCPTENDCLLAQVSQVHFWLQDMESVEKLLDPKNLLAFSHQREIKSRLSQAFACGRQIKVKRDLYKRSTEAAFKIYSLAHSKEYNTKEIEPIIKIIDDGNKSELVEEIVSVADIMSAFVGLCSHLLTQLGLQVNLTEEEMNWAVNHFEKLELIGITQDEIDNAISTIFERSLEIQYELAYFILECMNKLRNYFSSKGLPTFYNARILFTPNELLVNFKANFYNIHNDK